MHVQDMAALLESGVAADVTFKVEDEEMKVHRIILQVRPIPCRHHRACPLLLSLLLSSLLATVSSFLTSSPSQLASAIIDASSLSDHPAM